MSRAGDGKQVSPKHNRHRCPYKMVSQLTGAILLMSSEKFVPQSEAQYSELHSSLFHFITAGDLRWSRPVPVECDVKNEEVNDKEKYAANVNKTLKRTYHALKFASDCFQVNPFTKKFTGSEDCLYLNIWTPTIDESVSCCTPSPSLSCSLHTLSVSLNHQHSVSFSIFSFTKLRDRFILSHASDAIVSSDIDSLVLCTVEGTFVTR